MAKPLPTIEEHPTPWTTVAKRRLGHDYYIVQDSRGARVAVVREVDVAVLIAGAVNAMVLLMKQADVIPGEAID